MRHLHIKYPLGSLSLLLLLCSALLCSVLLSPGAWAGPKGKVETLKYGPNQIDLNGDGAKGIVMVGRRENFNAHDYNYVSFYVNLPKSRRNWHLAIVDYKGDKILWGAGRITGVTVNGGADCTLNDIRLLQPNKQGKRYLIVAKRIFGQTYADAEKVHFYYFVLEHNKNWDVGDPLYYWKFSKKVVSKKEHCDVNDAFGSELGLGYRGTRNVRG